jgi:hypothetical protein
MKAIVVLFALFVFAMGVIAAQPVTPAVSAATAVHSTEPIWMVLSGATLLVLASAVRRYVP